VETDQHSDDGQPLVDLTAALGSSSSAVTPEDVADSSPVLPGSDDVDAPEPEIRIPPPAD
jgi:hypothetical protein